MTTHAAKLTAPAGARAPGRAARTGRPGSDPVVPRRVPAATDSALWRTAGLRTLFAASTSARLANEAARVALVLLVLDRTGSPVLAGAAVAAMTLPALVTGPVIGAWLDRTQHRRLVFVANQVLLCLGLVGLLLLTGHAPVPLVLLLALAAGTTSPVLTGGFTGLVAPLVPPHLLRRAYGAEATSYNVAGVAGPALAGTVSATAGPGAAVALTAVVSALALLAVLRVPMPPADGRHDRGLARTVADGLALLFRTPALRSVTTTTTLAFAGMGAMPVAFPLLAAHFGAGPAAGGLLFSTFAVGALAGSLLVAARTPRTGPLRLTFAGVAALGLGWAALAFVPSLPIAVAVIALTGAVEGPVLASTLTVREMWSPARMRTQVVTTAASLKFGGFALGSAVAGAAAAYGGVRTAVLVAAGFHALGVVAGLAVAGRLLRRS